VSILPSLALSCRSSSWEFQSPGCIANQLPSLHVPVLVCDPTCPLESLPYDLAAIVFPAAFLGRLQARTGALPAPCSDRRLPDQPTEVEADDLIEFNNETSDWPSQPNPKRRAEPVKAASPSTHERNRNRSEVGEMVQSKGVDEATHDKTQEGSGGNTYCGTDQHLVKSPFGEGV